MTTPERRFNEAEVAAIFERAAARDEPREESGRQLVPTSEGLTLAQLQDVGREIGIAPGVIAEAAVMLDVRERVEKVATRRFLGLPVGVERTVQLRRRLSDEEWERLVVQLREIFDARGVMRQEGSLRQWRNGNLQALLEPTDDAQRIRLRTFKGTAPSAMLVGLAITTAGGIGLASAVLGGGASDLGMMASLWFTSAAGAAMMGVTAVRLFPWARRRREQMAEVAARIASLDRPRLADAGSTPVLPPPAR